MCYELIDRIIIGGSQSVTGKEREIEIVYKIDISSVMRHRLKKQHDLVQKHNKIAKSVCFNAIHTLF